MMMDITVANNISAAVTFSSASPSPSPQFHLSWPIRIGLIIIYTIVLLVGITGLILMMSLLKTNIRSLITIVFLNLMVAHLIFLLTVPFRIYYYATETWQLGPGVCKLVSAMVHIHIYMVFAIYAILLTLRFLHFYKKTQRTEFYRRLHALGASAVGWFILLLIMLPVVLCQYGQKANKNNNTTGETATENHCFKFEDQLDKESVKIMNLILSLVIITVSCVQTCIQAIILRTMIVKYGAASRFQQEFWVQIKNLIFVLIMLTCLVPYHLFRLEYLKNTKGLQEINEVFLAITGLTCVDMLTFTGKGVCTLCWS